MLILLAQRVFGHTYSGKINFQIWILFKGNKKWQNEYLISINEQRRFTSKGGKMTNPHGISCQASISHSTLQIVWSLCLSQIPNITLNCQKNWKKGIKSWTLMLRHLTHQLTTFVLEKYADVGKMVKTTLSERWWSTC